MSESAPTSQREVLPPLYDRWLTEAGIVNIPREEKATCGSCAMLPSSGDAASVTDSFFTPNAKCCTYPPTLPNFLVGGVLADEDAAPHARRAVIERIDGRLNVSPLFFEALPVKKLLYRTVTGRAFGRAEELRCGYYVDST